MENARSRGRKRYCCCYCNVYFYQIDSWQRHNRKHTGVEIECDDCGEMCSDSFELKSHQQLCEAYRVYSEELYTAIPTGDGQTTNILKISSNKPNEDIHDTPDSTSKQESIIENDDERGNRDERQSPSWKISNATGDESDKKQNLDSDPNEENSKHADLEDLIGEDKEANRMLDTPDENEDPETEALIGIDQSEVDDKPIDDNSIGVDSQIVIKVENALNDPKRDFHNAQEKGSRNIDSTYLSRPSPNSLEENNQTISMENSELNKKYQPYFCKNCGARFTRKDSVTRHLKKGTCSGKSAIVCNICGKVFPEIFELQEHFKLDHKNVLFTPPTVVTHRSILPKPDLREQAQHYSSYPTPFVLREQHLPPGARPYVSVDQPYRALQSTVQPAVFYAPTGNQSPYRQHRNTFPHPSPSSHYRDQSYGSRHYDMKYSPRGSKEPSRFIDNPSKHHNRKREYMEYHPREPSREHFYDREDFNAKIKRGKPDYELHEKYPYKQNEKIEKKLQINLSEYTNNAMNSQQYYNKRYVQKELQPVEKDEPGRMHRCKICGNEFPRFEYLLTHLRKHKEKPENESEDAPTNHRENNNNDDFPPHVPSSLNDSTSSDDSNDNHKNSPNYINSQLQDRPTTIYSSSHEPVTIVLPQPTVNYGSQQQQQQQHNNNRYSKQHHGEPHLYSPQASYPHNSAPLTQDGNVEIIRPVGVDGKFRPFICENCGQRFTRKDSLVRHAKKQTCFEEQTELKCKHCDKTFRYHKCLIQHQELVHGISREEQSKQMPHHSDDEDSDSDKSEKNENYPPMKKENLPHDSKHYNELKHVMDGNQPSMKREIVDAKHNQPTFHMLPHNPLTPLHQRHPFQRPPYHHIHDQSHPSIQAPKFILPKSDEKVPQQHEGSASGNQQDAQYIGYCTVPRPFQCEYCGDRFAHRHSLKRHVRRHLGIGIPCHECGKLYRDQSEWRRHQRSIHNRHYEKYEVPSRVSFRDGTENGMIGVVNQNEYNADQEEGSDTDDDDDISMVNNSTGFYSDKQNESSQPILQRSEEANEPNHDKNDVRLSSPSAQLAATVASKEENGSREKDDPKVQKSFNFKSFAMGDKDSRKSALDRYLRSPQSDEEDGVDQKSYHINHGDDNNNNNCNNNDRSNISMENDTINSNNNSSSSIEDHNIVAINNNNVIESHM